MVDVYEDATKRFLQDPLSEMTYGRRIARWMVDHGWYGPDPSPSTAQNAPSLEKAWAFYEHVTLQRYVDERSTRGVGGLQRERSARFFRGERKLAIAEPGEHRKHTRLYPIFSTPLSQLGDFGLGFGIYFATVKDFAAIMLLCGILSIPNILFYGSNDYSESQDGVPFLLKGSAICTERSWVPCPNCSQAEFDSSSRGAYNVDRYAEAWAVETVEEGFYLNVTDFLEWDYEGADVLQLNKSEITRLVSTENLIGASIPEQYNISLTHEGGYILNGVNVTKEYEKDYGGTPLWCGYRGPADCYLDLYPQFPKKESNPPPNNNSIAYYIGDTNFLLVGFALKNHCNGATRNQGWINWGTLLVMIVGVFYIRVRNDQIETKFDEDEQTAQDYSVVIKNPPHDAWDPQEWADFFEHALKQENGGVALPGHKVMVCTIDVDNGRVVEFLVERREILRRLEMALPPGTPLTPNSLQQQVQIVQQQEAESSTGCLNASKIPKLVESLQKVEGEIKNFFNACQRPPTTKVYCTFDTEDAQRKVLTKSCVGTYQARTNDVDAVPPHFLFRGKHVLRLREAHEPNDIRWQDLNTTRESMLYRKIATTFCTVLLMFLAYLLISTLYKKNMNWTASILTTLLTSAFPIVAVGLMELEKHYSETQRQAWLFAKVTLFNIFLTTVLLAVVTPFEATLDQKQKSLPGLLPAVDALFFSQVFITPVVQLLDIGGNVKRHVMAPRAKTQDEMNLCMRGTPVHLAVRYGNMMKFLYMTLWYCAIYPIGFFLGALALGICYFVDRFSLMRSWARSPHVGADISYFARRYFTPVAICLMSVASAYYWSGFPYDNLCAVENMTLPDFYMGQHDIVFQDNAKSIDVSEQFGVLGDFNISFTLYDDTGTNSTIEVTDPNEVYKFCNQDIRSYVGQPSFPALPQWQPEGAEWMEEEQERVVSVHGWTSLAVIIIVVVSIGITIFQYMSMYYTGAYNPRGEDQEINFHDVPSIASYIPQVESELLAYPLILCRSEDLDSHLFSWHDPARPHSHYDVTRDVEDVLGTPDYPDVFAKVQHWHHDGHHHTADGHLEPNGHLPEGEGHVEKKAAAVGGKPNTLAEPDEFALFPPDVTYEIDVDAFASTHEFEWDVSNQASFCTADEFEVLPKPSLDAAENSA